MSSVRSLLTSQKRVVIICNLRKIVTSVLQDSSGPNELMSLWWRNNVTLGGDCITQTGWGGRNRVNESCDRAPGVVADRSV